MPKYLLGPHVVALKTFYQREAEIWSKRPETQQACGQKTLGAFIGGGAFVEEFNHTLCTGWDKENPQACLCMEKCSIYFSQNHYSTSQFDISRCIHSPCQLKVTQPFCAQKEPNTTKVLIPFQVSWFATKHTLANFYTLYCRVPAG